MAYTFKYQLEEAPTADLSGAGLIDFKISLVYSSTGANYVTVPNYSKTIQVDADQIKIIMDMADGTPAQKNSKNNVLKDAIKKYSTNQTSYDGINWSVAYITRFVTELDKAITQAARVDNYLKVTLGLTYPISFNL